jgi:hypothetical protein
MRVLPIVAVNHWQLLLLLMVQVDSWMPGLQEDLVELGKPAWREDREARGLMFSSDSGAARRPLH